MGTRAIYIFEDVLDHFGRKTEVYVYKQLDNYPAGAADFIENAKQFAWKLPRFEADEFAAAFVAANKDSDGGGVRLVNANFTNRMEMLDTHHLCDYHYVISKPDTHSAVLWIEIWQMRYDMDIDHKDWVLIDELEHTEMKEKYRKREAV